MSVNLLDTRTSNLLELLGNGRIYRVPPYQRDYSWEVEQWEDLWTDLQAVADRPQDRHYMGALVVEGKSDREFLLIDGQQRVATLSLLALAVIGRLQCLAEEQEPQSNRERAVQLRQLFIGRKDPASLVESSRLFLNQRDDPFYQDYLVQLRAPLNPRGLPRSNRLLWDCFRYFTKRVDDEGSGERLARLLSEAAGRQLLFILITVSDELSAYTVFETLNARGLELSTTDLLKNYLFSRLRVTADLEALQRRWQALLATVRQEKFPDFLRYHLLCEKPRVRSERMFKLVRQEVTSPQHVFALMDALQARAELYSALSDPNHGYWAEHPECRPFIRELQLFQVRQMTPLLFAAWEGLAQHFAAVLRIVSVISFRYSVVSGLNTNALEPVYHRAARELLAGHVAGPAQLFEMLQSIYVEDARLEQDLSTLTLRTSGQGKKLARYVLARLESDASGRHCDPDTDPASLEHILPENPGADWEVSLPRAHWEEAIYRLGNLSLLEPSVNRRVGNAPYGVKVEDYARSSYALTRQVAQMAPGEWTMEHLNARQRCLAARAVHLWRLDY